jgi:hypothetical protein
MKKNIHANPILEAQQAYQAAGTLLDKQDESQQMYAALELRRCIESVVYQKLQVYGAVLPEDSVYKWQAAHAFDALIEIEPDAEESFTMAVGLQEAPDKPSAGLLKVIGTDHRPNNRWVKKTWQKLGSYLHAEWPFAKSTRPSVPPRNFLIKTFAELAPPVNSSFSFAAWNVIEFDCSCCGAVAKVIDKVVESTRRATCFSCDLRYRAEKDEEGFKFYPDANPFTCECGAENFVAPHRVKIGYSFPCRACKRVFEIVRSDWHYTVAAGAQPSLSETE